MDSGHVFPAYAWLPHIRFQHKTTVRHTQGTCLIRTSERRGSVDRDVRRLARTQGGPDHGTVIQVHVPVAVDVGRG